MELNKNWFLEINSLAGHNHILDKIMIFSAKGIPFIFALMLIYLWFSNRKNESLFVVHSVIIGLIISTILHIIYFHPRPFMEHLGTLLIHHKADTSFPSDHTTLSFSVAFMLLMFQSTRKFGIVAIILAILCGIGRIYTGVHWPFDVIGGIVVGFIASSLVLFLKSRLQYFNDYVIDMWDKLNYGNNS
ncbi:MAG: undecaprenyl-diphosphatase [Nautilia sp.]|nr:MAG: undecaprenyl-diphosphatase [Nautilia sp.]